MNIIQISPPKTGSYWLHTILTKILQAKGVSVGSFIQELPVYQELKNQKLSFKGQAGVDMIDIENDGCYYRVSSLLKKPIADLSDYAKKTNLVWTHSTYCNTTSEVFRYFNHKICLVRDPRDRALSVANFAFTPYMKTYYPSSYDTPKDYLEDHFEKLMEQWVWFYGNYLLKRDSLDLHFIFYENLLNSFPNELDSLINYLNIGLRDVQKENLQKDVSFSHMKSKSPGHLHKGRSRKWVDGLTDDQKQIAVEKAGYLMELLGYPLSDEEDQTRLKIPRKIPEKTTLKILNSINWRDLY